MSLIVRTLSEQIFDILKEKIVGGQLSSEQPIRQDALAAELGVSKIPLREALARLEQEGLLYSQANRGFFVRMMTSAEAEEIYALRLAIEPAAVGMASVAANQEERDLAVEALKALDEAANHNLELVTARNRDFHMALIRPCRRELTVQLIGRLQTQAERYTYKHLEPAGRGDRAHLEHTVMLKAWLSRNAQRAEELAAAHITGTLEDLRRQFEVN